MFRPGVVSYLGVAVALAFIALGFFPSKASACTISSSTNDKNRPALIPQTWAP